MARPTDKCLEAYIRSKNKPSDAQGAVKELVKKLKEARKSAWDDIKRERKLRKSTMIGRQNQLNSKKDN
jgi:hypothetical protein